MKKSLFTLLFLAMALMLYAQNPKYVFLFIGDGMSTPQRMLAEEYTRKYHNRKLVINDMEYHSMTRTSSASSLITDSAASATAIACGIKTKNGRLGMDFSGKEKVESVAEVAKKRGKKVGIVTTVVLNHATPGGFYAKQPSRKLFYEIGLDLINSSFDYFGGGGLHAYNNKKSPLYKGDLYKLAAKKGYKVARDMKSFKALKKGSGKVLTVGAPGALPYAIDSEGKAIPTLAQYTAKGIELLDNPKGFFMMVEGGSIDYAGHGNEAAANLREVLAFDDAVKVAVDFAKKHPKETLIIVTGDHETGGMTLGHAKSSLRLDVLKNQKCSHIVFNGILARERKAAAKAKKEFTFKDAQKLVTKYFSFKFSKADKEGTHLLSASEIKELEKAFQAKRLGQAVKTLVNRRSGVGWTTPGHTALPVLTSSSGVKAELFKGFIENSDIAIILKKIL